MNEASMREVLRQLVEQIRDLDEGKLIVPSSDKGSRAHEVTR